MLHQAPWRKEVAAAAGVDWISALPDDILVLILLRLDTIAEAARTSVLSRRWRRVWALLPVLLFPDGRHIREVLAASEAPALRLIFITTNDDTAESVAAWLPLAARRLSGDLTYNNRRQLERYEEEEGAVDQEQAVPLPCFESATTIDLDLGFLPLALPSSGEFARLAQLHLKRVRFHGRLKLGNVVSSPRCPVLRLLSVVDSFGLDTLTVHSKSLLKMELRPLNGFREITIDAQALKELILFNCFGRNQPVANIAAPELV
ncbi:hypothetical protein PR202_ga28583 [Eleusine coracana subsp. coracana]|uniref:F-box domain-containing protein n=1 Tax=Eleusine coracana subsp. coracana TaxID=191504 RepID=A0AAV5DJ70_ELECO|nr:hypothetical protein PR202_ga28583 [Eleusine coracana subsp. coracana]